MMKMTFKCPACGDDAVYADGTLWWDDTEQAWVASDDAVPTKTTTLYCGSCGEETTAGEAMAELDGPTTYTVWVCEVRPGGGIKGTHHVSSHPGPLKSAKAQALAETAADWGWVTIDGLHVLGVVAGDATLVEWDELV